jgi:hypothetical protein
MLTEIAGRLSKLRGSDIEHMSLPRSLENHCATRSINIMRLWRSRNGNPPAASPPYFL